MPESWINPLVAREDVEQVWCQGAQAAVTGQGRRADAPNEVCGHAGFH